MTVIIVALCMNILFPNFIYNLINEIYCYIPNLNKLVLKCIASVKFQKYTTVLSKKASFFPSFFFIHAASPLL